jgi:L-ascorbate metabolism protein UlaG (beta-lactamase superfamily)
MQSIHLDPKEAVIAHQDLRSQQSLGIHFGVFQLTWEPVDQPLSDLTEALSGAQIDPERFWTLEPGEFRTLP